VRPSEAVAVCVEETTVRCPEPPMFEAITAFTSPAISAPVTPILNRLRMTFATFTGRKRAAAATGYG